MKKKILVYVIAFILCFTTVGAGTYYMLIVINDADWFVRWTGIFVQLLMIAGGCCILYGMKLFLDE